MVFQRLTTNIERVFVTLSGRTEKQLSAKISRHLKLLRVHGIIRKLPRQNRYQVTIKGMKLAKALNALLAASTENLLKMAA